MFQQKLLRVLLVLCAFLPACASSQPSSSGAAPVFFPEPPAEPRLQFLGTLSSADDIEDQSGFAELVIGSKRTLALARPHGTVWWHERLYVCDPGAGSLMVFDFAEKELRRAVESESRILRKPIAIGVAPDGWKYVVDVKRSVIVVLDAEDRFRTTFGDPDGWRPVGVAVGRERLFVADVLSHSIVVLDRASGERVAVLGGEGTDIGSFYYPVAVTFGPDGDLWVTDSFNFRIQRLRTDGTPVESFGEVGDRPGMFARPKSAAVDAAGRVFVVDGAFENIQFFDAKRRLLLFFGAPGEQPGAMNLPAHVTISYEAIPQFADRVASGRELEYVIFVSSQLGTERVSVYGLLRPR